MPILGCIALRAWVILLCCKRTKKPFFNYANKFKTSFFFDFCFRKSVLVVLLIQTLSPHLCPQTSNPITHCSFRIHWIRIFIYTDSGWTPLVEFLLVMDGIVRWAQQEDSRPRWCFLFITRWKLFLFLQFSHVSLLGPSEAHMKRRRVIQQTILSLSFVCYVCVFLWRNEKSSGVSYIQ